MPGTKLRGVALELYNTTVKVTGVRDVTLDVQSTEADASDHDSGAWGETMTGTWKWSAQVTGLYIDTDSSQIAIRSQGIAGTATTFHIRPNGTGTGKTTFDGSARVKNYKLTGPQDGVQAFSFDLAGVGALTETTQA